MKFSNLLGAGAVVVLTLSATFAQAEELDRKSVV